MSTKIEGQVALVTGANRGIGKATVKSLIEAGASKVYLAVRNLDSTSDLVNEYGSKVSPIFVDVSQQSAISELANQTQDVNIVVNNAGVLEPSGLLEPESEQSLEKEFNVNVLGLLRMSKAYAPILEKNGGAFVQLNSVASIINFTDFTTYSASKAAAYSITQGLRDTFREKNIQVVSVHPGPIATDMAAQIGMTEIADDVSAVSNGIVAALKSGDFLLFPDTMAKDFEAAYASYAENIILPIQEEA